MSTYLIKQLKKACTVKSKSRRGQLITRAITFIQSASKEELNKTDEDGYTALHWAVDVGDEDVVVALLEKGVKRLIKDNRGHTPAYWAKAHLDSCEEGGEQYKAYSHILGLLKPTRKHQTGVTVTDSVAEEKEESFIASIEPNDTTPLTTVVNEPESKGSEEKASGVDVGEAAWSDNEALPLERQEGTFDLEAEVKQLIAQGEKGRNYYEAVISDWFATNHPILHAKDETGKQLIDWVLDYLSQDPDNRILKKMAKILVINQPDEKGYTTLHYALDKTQPLAAVHTLLERYPHIDPTVADSNGESPLDWAKYYYDNPSYTSLGKEDKAEAKRQYREILHVFNELVWEHEYPLHAAVYHDESVEEIEQALKKHPEAVNQLDHLGHTPLHIAAANHVDIELLEYLINKGAQVNAINPVGIEKERYQSDKTEVMEKGWSALHYAVAAGDDEAANVLLQRGAEPFLKDDRGNTPLHVAATHDASKEIVITLLNQAEQLEGEQGALNLLTTKNKQNQLPLDLALSKEFGVLLEAVILLEQGQLIDGNAKQLAESAFFQSKMIEDGLPDSAKAELLGKIIGSAASSTQHEQAQGAFDRALTLFPIDDWDAEDVKDLFFIAIVAANPVIFKTLLICFPPQVLSPAFMEELSQGIEETLDTEQSPLKRQSVEKIAELLAQHRSAKPSAVSFGAVVKATLFVERLKHAVEGRGLRINLPSPRRLDGKRDALSPSSAFHPESLGSPTASPKSKK